MDSGAETFSRLAVVLLVSVRLHSLILYSVSGRPYLRSIPGEHYLRNSHHQSRQRIYNETPAKSVSPLYGVLALAFTYRLTENSPLPPESIKPPVQTPLTAEQKARADFDARVNALLAGQ